MMFLPPFMRTREAVEPQRLSPMGANSTISLRARGGGRGTTPIETPGSRGIPRAVSPMETSLFFFIPFLGQTPIHPGVHRPQVQGKERECRYQSLILQCFPRGPGAGRVRAGWAAPRSHRISIRMNFPYAAAKKTDGKTINAATPRQIWSSASSSGIPEGSATGQTTA